MVINDRELGHKLWESIKYDTVNEQTWECKECWQAPKPASSNKEKETSLLMPEESKEGKQIFISLRAPCIHSSSLDVTNDIFNIHKVKNLTTAFPQWDFTFNSFALFMLLQVGGKTDFLEFYIQDSHYW